MIGGAGGGGTDGPFFRNFDEPIKTYREVFDQRLSVELRKSRDTHGILLGTIISIIESPLKAKYWADGYMGEQQSMQHAEQYFTSIERSR